MVRECADAPTFKRPTPDVRVFVLGRGQRDDSVDNIIIIGSDGVACGNVHRGRRCAAADDDDANGNTDTSFSELNLIYYYYLFI